MQKLKITSIISLQILLLSGSNYTHGKVSSVQNVYHISMNVCKGGQRLQRQLKCIHFKEPRFLHLRSTFPSSQQGQQNEFSSVLR